MTAPEYIALWCKHEEMDNLYSTFLNENCFFLKSNPRLLRVSVFSFNGQEKSQKKNYCKKKSRSRANILMLSRKWTFKPLNEFVNWKKIKTLKELLIEKKIKTLKEIPLVFWFFSINKHEITSFSISMRWKSEKKKSKFLEIFSVSKYHLGLVEKRYGSSQNQGLTTTPENTC